MTLHHPRRLTPPAAPGTLLKCFAVPPRRNRSDAYTDPDYLALVRQMPCLSCGHDPCGEAAHVRFASAAFGRSSGLGKKPADRDALPLCRDDHQLNRDAQHKRNEFAFWQDLNINPYLVAEKLYAQRGDYGAMRAVIYLAIAERSRATTDIQFR
jgi:hypothetical protein